MSVNELRKDYILDRWVAIASKRKRRPTDFVKAREEKRVTICPFCPGNEHLTPPAVLVYLEEKGEIRKEKDLDGFRHKGWLIRCIPNLYPAFSPPTSQTAKRNRRLDFLSMDALGHHEVLIESPEHDEHPSVARISQLIHIIHAYIDRFRALSSHNYVKYVSIFRNHGADAGASLSHAHTQIIATPIMPRIIKEESDKSREHYEKSGECIFCEVIKRERESERFIWENRDFIVFSPWAGIHPFEFWIFPKKHQSTILELSEGEIKNLAVAMRVSLGGLRALLGDPSYNFGFHMVNENHYHWHIEVYPRLAVWAGFEKSTGMFINVMPPEEAAGEFREAFIKESERLRF
ncbi:MAG: galactose-1-phosphate uridylyltransferase [Candidatus Asgardarchaeia archaeon]